MMLDCCMLHSQLTANVSGMVHTHGMWVEDVNLKKVVGCSLLKSVLVSSPLHLARFHQSSFFIRLSDSSCNTIVMAYSNHSSDDMQYYVAISIIQFKSLAILIHNQISLRYTSDFPILLHYPPKCTQVLEQKQSHGCVCLCPRQE